MKIYVPALLAVLAASCAAHQPVPTPKGSTTMPDTVKQVLSDPVSRQQIHQAFSADCFNNCWTLIDKPNRSPEDVENMILLAHASLWHWKQRTDCQPLNLSIGYWQVARVYVLAGQYEMARVYGDKCLTIGQANHLAPFYIGYAHEALARAELLGRHPAQAREHLAAARGDLAQVTEKDERQLLAADLDQLEKSLAEKSDPGSLK